MNITFKRIISVLLTLLFLIASLPTESVNAKTMGTIRVSVRTPDGDQDVREKTNAIILGYSDPNDNWKWKEYKEVRYPSVFRSSSYVDMKVPVDGTYKLMVYVNDMQAAIVDDVQPYPHGNPRSYKVTTKAYNKFRVRLFYDDGRTPVKDRTVKIYSHERVNNSNGKGAYVWEEVKTDSNGYTPYIKMMTPDGNGAEKIVLEVDKSWSWNVHQYSISTRIKNNQTIEQSIDEEAPKQHRLRVKVNPTTKTILGYTISSEMGGFIDVEDDGEYNDSNYKDYYFQDDTEVTLEAIPRSGFVFSDWDGDYPSFNGSSSKITIKMDKNKDVSANFKKKDNEVKHKLSYASYCGGFERQGGQILYHGSSTSKNQVEIRNGDQVTLEARASTNQYGDPTIFDHWEGDVPSSQTNNPKITLTMDRSRNIKAVFKTVDISSISLNSSEKTLYLSDSSRNTATLDYTINPSYAINKNVTWQSSNPSTATVDNHGVVRARGVGETIITVRTESGALTDTCRIIVTDKPTGISITNKILSIVEGQRHQFRASVTPSTAQNKTIRWSSSNPNIIRVNSNDGTITTVGTLEQEKSERVTITARTEDGGYTDSCSLYVQMDTNRMGHTWATAKSLKKYSSASATLNGPNDVVYFKIDVDREMHDKGIHIYSSDIGQTSSNFLSAKLYTWRKTHKKTSEHPNDSRDFHIEWENPTMGDYYLKVVDQVGRRPINFTVYYDNYIPTDIPVEKLVLNTTHLSMLLGEKQYLEANIYPDNATNKEVLWHSSNTNVARIENGTVRAIGAGTAEITVTSAMDSSKYVRCTVTVTAKEVPVERISFNTTTLTLTQGASKTLQVNVMPNNATQKDIQWRSSDENIVKVENGMVQATGTGTAEVTAVSVTNSSKYATCIIMVKANNIPVERVKLNITELNLMEGESSNLKASVLPYEATNQDIKWFSSNDLLVSVENGVVHAIREGVAEIYAASVQNPKQYVKCYVTVKAKKIPIESISLGITNISLLKEQSKNLVATIYPYNAISKEIVWSSSDNKVATVENGKIKAVGVGTCIITATSSIDKTKYARCTVEVVLDEVPVGSIALNTTNLDIVQGESEQLDVAIHPTNATNKEVLWLSSNEKVATIENGKVKAIGKGTCDITVTSAVDSSKYAKCVVTVKAIPIVGFELNKSILELYKGQSETLLGKIYPDTVVNKTILWKSSDENVATVDNGHIKAIGEGTCLITATAESDNSFSFNCTIVVSEEEIKPTDVTIALNEDEHAILLDEEKSLVYKLYKDNEEIISDSIKIQWQSSNEKIVQVNDDGKAIGVAEGVATITASVIDGQSWDSCVIMVKNEQSTNINLSHEIVTMTIGDRRNITYSVYPDTMKMTLVSSKPEVATIDQQGKIIAISSGISSIEARGEDGIIYDRCRVVILDHENTDVFYDLDHSHWAYEGISFMNKGGIIAGYSDGAFKPNNYIQRCEYAKILTASMGLKLEGNDSSSFNDVPSSHWAVRYIEASKPYLSWYMTPMGSQVFRPNQPALREDIAAALIKALGYDPEDANLEVLNQFSDANEISESLRPYIALIVEHGLMVGYDGKFAPKKPLTRAEASVLLYRLLDEKKFNKN